MEILMTVNTLKVLPRKKGVCERHFRTQSFKAENTNFQPLNPKSFWSSEEHDVVFLDDIVEAYYKKLFRFFYNGSVASMSSSSPLSRFFPF